ncbi:MAG TPA: branched-chain amino acid ABC transporter permease [Syntrophorhabdales bacterium]|nr:branched-chain amino acid ABC transporter permease [Syntrophorhabdales bacterium]
MSKSTIAGAAVLLLALIGLPWFVNPYVLQVVILTIVYSMLGLAFAFTLRVGLPRFDVAAWWGVGAYVTAMLVLKAGVSFWLTIPAAGIIAVILGWVIFKIVIPRGMMVFLLAGMVLTMATQQIFASVPFFGGWGGTDVIPFPKIGPITFIDKTAVYFLGLVFLGINLLVYRVLLNSRIGRAWTAIGSSLGLASSVGVDVVKYRMANVLIGNFFIAVAGSYLVASTLVAIPTMFTFTNSISVMMYVVVGGISYSLVGPIIGAIIVTFIPEYLRMAKEYEPIITSAAIILIIIFIPGGILGLVKMRIWPWLVRRLS